MKRQGSTAALRAGGWAVAVALAALLAAGCGSHVANRNAVGAAAALAHAPTSQLHQIYYLGVFDPADQTPPTIYRIRVQAQGSALSSTQYASGWVPAAFIDSLSGRGAELLGGYTSPTAASAPATSFLKGRRHFVFGPEGYREVPQHHRLVVVMGADPSAFFAGIDQALGTVAEATQGTAVQQELLRRLISEQEDLKAERKDIAAVVAKPLKAETAK